MLQKGQNANNTNPISNFLVVKKQGNLRTIIKGHLIFDRVILN